MPHLATVPPPSWLRRSITDCLGRSGSHVRAVEVQRHPDRAAPVHTVAVSFVFTDLGGRHVESTGLIHIPDTLEHDPGPLPLIFEAGYALDEATALSRAATGRVVVTHAPETDAVCGHPLTRGINVDAALLHIARRLPCVDDTRVVLHGVSAGGRISLLLAAETFPLAAVVAEVPPLNWPYNAAYLANNGALPAGTVASADAAVVIRQCQEVLGSHDVETSPWRELSPHTHVGLVTAPVAATFTTADVLVPVDQLGAAYAHRPPPGLFPAGYTTDPAELLQRAENRRRLVDVLPAGAANIRVVPVPASAARLDITRPSAVPYARIEVEPSERPWTVTVIDEGCPEPDVHHFKHAVHVDTEPFVAARLRSPGIAGQLSPDKLIVLMRRFASRPWLVHGYPHADVAAAERADVVRGLRTYVAAGGAEGFGALYRELPDELRVLGAEVARARPAELDGAFARIAQ